MNPIQVIQALNLLMNLATQIGVNLDKYLELRGKAEAEGRDITLDEVEQVLRESQVSLDSLQAVIDEHQRRNH